MALSEDGASGSSSVGMAKSIENLNISLSPRDRYSCAFSRAFSSPASLLLLLGAALDGFMIGDKSKRNASRRSRSGMVRARALAGISWFASSRHQVVHLSPAALRVFIFAMRRPSCAFTLAVMVCAACAAGSIARNKRSLKRRASARFPRTSPRLSAAPVHRHLACLHAYQHQTYRTRLII